MNGSLRGHDTLKACDVVAEPLSGASRGTGASVNTLWGTGFLGEGTDSGRAEVVKGSGGGTSDTALVSLAHRVGLTVHELGGDHEAVGLVGGEPLATVDGSAHGFDGLLLGGVGARVAVFVVEGGSHLVVELAPNALALAKVGLDDGISVAEEAITGLEGGGEFVGLVEPLDITAEGGDTVASGVQLNISVVALGRGVGEGEGLGQVAVASLGAEPV